MDLLALPTRCMKIICKDEEGKGDEEEESDGLSDVLTQTLSVWIDNGQLLNLAGSDTNTNIDLRLLPRSFQHW